MTASNAELRPTTTAPTPSLPSGLRPVVHLEEEMVFREYSGKLLVVVLQVKGGPVDKTAIDAIAMAAVIQSGSELAVCSMCEEAYIHARRPRL